ncbi:[protein-PII] uridylyltransferase [Methyloversatilis sp.]|uniref:[protein-PII] uridylyltransferase n=3 Tax=Methyloversatilis sp. TaxID=2569862 RepID=UPI002735EAC7|nr:[protein-PII] uridylyltransferase [Methyloversatilis sp.]MDP3455601.1 [protein-PII] uridylyltransferase [Methyloversatilis sp.]MDP3577462.1 [protein-PII] uridylyltransferase [Methyloversatilis sp.]
MDAPVGTDALRLLAATLRAELSAAQQRLRETFERDGNSQRLLRDRARAVDAALRQLWAAAGMPRTAALVAVGGYGRGELYPASDVDLLFLTPPQLSPDTESRLEMLVGLLWDIGLDIGHSVRSVGQCVDEASRDITVETTLLEARLLAGSRRMFRELSHALATQRDPGSFFKAKRLEQDERHQRYQETPYSLEPNCKESPGGLRDLQVIQWIARASQFGSTWAELAARGLITPTESRQLHRIERFMRDTRVRLHLIARRREDRLIFDHQEALAAAFGMQATPTRRASEVFMQRYYRSAKMITQLNTILLQNISAALFPSDDTVVQPINARFQSSRELLDVVSEDVFENTPSALLECFTLLQTHRELKGMTARTLRGLWRARRLIDAKFRRDPQNRMLFLSLFQQTRGLVHEIRRMNQYGILGRYLPAFGRIVGQMQHDLFHVYTVDQHILQVMRNVRRFTMAEHAHEYPLLSRLITAFERRWLLYLSALFHDIAKGRGGDHSKLGMHDARLFCLQHGIDAEDADLVVFLVEHHLSMSSVAQKQDLSDPETIRAFAALVRTERRLTALYVLTHADIRGTSPKVWNAWRGKLLEDLYFSTLRVLQGESPGASGTPDRQEEARHLLRYFGLREGIENEFWARLDTVYFMRHEADEIAWHTRMLYFQANASTPVVKARPNQVGDGLQVMVYAPDQPDLFMRLCGFFGRLGYSIADAKIHTTTDRHALDSFILLDPNRHLNSRDMIALIETGLAERLQNQTLAEQPVTGRLSREVRHFPITPEVLIKPDERKQHHIMHVTAADRPGLLYSVARVLAAHHINLHTAKITTLGDRVEDVFLVSGAELEKSTTLIRLEQELLGELAIL